jgi:molybdenum cofactor guanylyltransferase
MDSRMRGNDEGNVMKLLGALIAGGQSRRFGSDKALALFDGKPLLAHVIEGLERQVDELVICGREWPGLASLPDRPAADQGPLGGLCAALHHARENGFDAVLTAGCDTLPVPDRLADLFGDQPAVIKDQPLFGFWPADLAPLLDAWLDEQPRRDMRGWIEHSGAREVDTPIAFSNLNTPEDYAQFTAHKGMTA